MNRFVRGMEQLKKRLSVAGALSVTYHHYTGSGFIVIAITKMWVGRTAFRIQDNDRIRIEWSDRDYLIPTEQLKDSNGNLFTPADGDYLQEMFENPIRTERYKLFSPNDEQTWRYSDPQHTLYRIHTKRFE